MLGREGAKHFCRGSVERTRSSVDFITRSVMRWLNFASNCARSSGVTDWLVAGTPLDELLDDVTRAGPVAVGTPLVAT